MCKLRLMNMHEWLITSNPTNLITVHVLINKLFRQIVWAKDEIARTKRGIAWKNVRCPTLFPPLCVCRIFLLSVHIGVSYNTWHISAAVLAYCSTWYSVPIVATRTLEENQRVRLRWVLLPCTCALYLYRLCRCKDI